MYLTVVKRIGNLLLGWDGYNQWQEVRVSSSLADKVGQSLCYEEFVFVDVPSERII